MNNISLKQIKRNTCNTTNVSKYNIFLLYSYPLVWIFYIYMSSVPYFDHLLSYNECYILLKKVYTDIFVMINAMIILLDNLFHCFFVFVFKNNLFFSSIFSFYFLYWCLNDCIFLLSVFSNTSIDKKKHFNDVVSYISFDLIENQRNLL